MIDINALDEFKDAYLDLLKNTMGEDLDENELYLAKDYSLIESIQREMKNLNLTIKLFLDAKKKDDDLAMQAALLRISTFLSGAYGILEQTREDVDRFVFLPNIKEFPENYKIPEHYNYPFK